ncbi:MAG TPA: AAA family ATPase [Rhizomicrobium sp.]|jgi:predicted ABC-type ATPase
MSKKPAARTRSRRAAHPGKGERPRFWIVAGPNGSGKSSAYGNAEIDGFGGTVWIINPDLLTSRIAAIEQTANPNLESVQRIECWLEASIRAHQTIGVETVLSTGKYQRLVTLAKSLQFEIRLIYIVLDSPELNIARVKTRVANGGHDVAEDKIRARYSRSLDQLPWFLNAADQAWLFDNSGARPKVIGTKQGGILTLDSGALPAIKQAAQKIRSS